MKNGSIVKRLLALQCEYSREPELEILNALNRRDIRFPDHIIGLARSNFNGCVADGEMEIRLKILLTMLDRPFAERAAKNGHHYFRDYQFWFGSGHWSFPKLSFDEFYEQENERRRVDKTSIRAI